MSGNLMLYLSLYCCLAMLSACLVTKKNPTQFIYDESINMQLWTAQWSPDDKYIAIAGVDSTLRIYHAKNLKLYQSWPIDTWIHKVAWHPSGKTLAIATSNKYIALLDFESGLFSFLTGTGGSRAMGWNHDGTLLAVADMEESIKIWNKDGVLITEVQSPYNPDIPGKTCLSLDWHPAENIFVVTNSQIYIMNEEGQILHVMNHSNPEAIILCASWHPSGSFFALGDYGFKSDDIHVPSLLHFWSRDGLLLKSLSGSKAEIRNLAWNNDGSKLASASDKLRIWSETGELLHESEQDGNNFLWGIDWNEKGTRIVTSHRFKSISIWDNKAKLIKKTYP